MVKKRIRQRQAVDKQHQILNGGKEESVSLQELQKPDHGPRRRTLNAKEYERRVITVQPKTPTKTKRRLPRTKAACTRCGRGSHSYERCPARTATCHSCNKKGHHSSKCFTKHISEVSHRVNVIDTTFIDTISSKRSSTWNAEVFSLKKQLETYQE